MITGKCHTDCYATAVFSKAGHNVQHKLFERGIELHELCHVELLIGRGHINADRVNGTAFLLTAVSLNRRAIVT
jgi:hypothetical protein